MMKWSFCGTLHTHVERRPSPGGRDLGRGITRREHPNTHFQKHTHLPDFGRDLSRRKLDAQRMVYSPRFWLWSSPFAWAVGKVQTNPPRIRTLKSGLSCKPQKTNLDTKRQELIDLRAQLEAPAPAEGEGAEGAEGAEGEAARAHDPRGNGS